jgi:LuxR family maltose regulon positive regulatory protein
MIPTKTIIPQRPAHLLHRPRLVDQLHRHVDLALTLLSAPAGHGKTSLLVDFAHDAPFPICWLSLDPSDRDLYTFVEYLVAAIGRRFPKFGRVTLSILTANPDMRRNPAALTGAIVQDMLDSVPEFFALILDDFHAVDGSREINELLERFLTHRPDHCHLILSSRTAPARLPIIQLTARSQIAGVGSTDLAFTAHEIQTLLAQAHQIHLSPAQAEELAQESEGWITGILLSTEAMWRGMRDSLARAKVQKGPIYAYLADQVFAQQTPELRDFLLTSSTLQEMNVTLCQEALGLTEVFDTLKEIERRGAFLMPLVDEATGTWFRYHHLFRDFLQTRLQKRTPERFRKLHQRAADWFEAHEQWENAVSHRLTAGDAHAAAQTMDAGLVPLFCIGRMETLVDWYEAVPESLRPEFPRLSLFAARALSHLGRPDEALPALGRAEAEFKERGEVEKALFAALTRANIWHVWGRHAEVLTLAQRVLDEAADYSAPAADAHRLAGIACLALGQLEEAVNHFRASLDLCRELGLVYEMGLVYMDLALALMRLGQLSEGWACQDRAVEINRQTGPSSHLAMMLNDIAYDRYYLTGDYAPALEYLTEALEIARSVGASRPQVFAMLTTADLYRGLGAVEQAAELYRKAEEIARQLGDLSLISFAVDGLAQCQILSGKTVEALGLAIQARDLLQDQENVWQLGVTSLTLSAARLAAGDPTKALADIEHGRDLLAQSRSRRDLTRAYMLLARVREATGDLAGALKALDKALNVGIETQTFHYLVVEGQRAFDLLKQFQKQNPADRRPAEILQRIRALPDVAREVVGGLAPDALPHPPMLRFCGFGPGSVERDGEPLSGPVWQSALARYILFYLLVHPPRNRDQIAATFWPDTSRDRAKAIFHTVKHQAHRALGRSVIVYEQGLYLVELEPDCWFDVTAFESLLDGQDKRQARLEEAVALYRGDFLEDYDAEWCLPMRERLRLRFRDALLELGECQTDQGQFERAFVTLSQAVEIDDLHEPASRALMRLYALDGRSHAALIHYEQLVQRLQKELGTRPASETQALYQAIRDGDIPA